MGTIVTTGVAARKVECDKMNVKLVFKITKSSSKEAIEEMIKESEDFLSMMNNAGFDIQQIRGSGDSVSKESVFDDNNSKAERTLEWDSVFDLKSVDILTQMIGKGSYDVEMIIEPYYSKAEALHKELVKEAITDARETADEIAESIGVKIKGPAGITVDPYRCREYSRDSLAVRGFTCYDDYQETVFSQLSSHIRNEEEEILIEWELE